MRLLATLCVSLIASAAVADEFTGTVTKVHDGDTVHVEKADGTVVNVRFLFVDTPEIDQPHGVEARDFVANQIFGEEVTVKSNEVDVHGRALGEIIFNGKNINEELIKEGHGWWFFHYHADRPDLGELEVAAKAAGLGLWDARNPVYPRNWRDGARIGGGGPSGGSGGNGNGTTSPSARSNVFIMAAMPNPRELDEGNESVVIGNRDHEQASITGWELLDDDGGTFELSGTVPAGGALTIRLDNSLQLGNGGDVIILKDADRNEVHRISYGSASAGQFVVAE